MEQIKTNYVDGNHRVYQVSNNDEFCKFLNQIRGSDSIRQFCYYAGIDYNLGYSVLTGRRNTSLKVFFDMMYELGYEVLLVDYSGGNTNEKTREITAAQDE